MSATTADWVAILDEQLLELADGDETAIGFLALAEESMKADRDRQLQISGWVQCRLTGTAGERLVAWAELTEAVWQWHRLDRLGEAAVDHTVRERVADEVAYALGHLTQRWAA